MNSHSHANCPPSVTFLGAARSVTGSMHLVECGPYRILLDCGQTRGTHEERRRDQDLPFDPAWIDAVVLSHAHTDHCNLPTLVRQGFSGPIYCTPATADLIDLMLADSARIQEQDTRVASVAGGARPSREKAYGRRDVDATVDLAVAVEYGEAVDISPDIQLRFTDAGHILGSAVVSLTMHQGGRDHTLTFTGDLGRRGLPFLKDPPAVPAADLIITESTYGGKTHDTVEGMAHKMSQIVKRTAVRGGKVLIPAFSLGRTQVVLHYVRRWMAAGLLPQLPLYVDSPLASKISLVHDDYPDLLLAGADDTGVPVRFLMPDEADVVTAEDGPAVIIASGGMCDGGRILYHLKHHIDDPRASLVLVSYQSPLSLGATLLQKGPTVRFHGRKWNKWIEVEQINGFSGHADQTDFAALLGGAVGKTGKVRLVHGEVDQALALEARLGKMGFADVAVPMREEVVTMEHR